MITQSQSITGHIEELHVSGGEVNIYGHVNDLHMSGGKVYNYGKIDDFHGARYTQTIPQVKIEYRDRVKEVIKWKYRDREKIVYRDNDDTAHLRDLLEAAMEVNRRQAERIKELEKTISEHREAQMPDPWNIRPTKMDCERVLKQYDIFL